MNLAQTNPPLPLPGGELANQFDSPPGRGRGGFMIPMHSRKRKRAFHESSHPARFWTLPRGPQVHRPNTFAKAEEGFP